MRSLVIAWGLCAVLGAAESAAAPGVDPEPAPLALPAFDPRDTRDWLAQRVITREWGASDDSTYREVSVAGWKSEGLAMAMSSVLPGAGQLYAGERSAYLYLLAEAAGWTGWVFAGRLADRYRTQSERYLGDPRDSSSNWSFDRYARATGGDVSRLREIYAADRDAFYQTLLDDFSLGAGFATPRDGVYRNFNDLRALSDRAFRQRRGLELFLWVQHVVSAVDAFRAARFHNVPLQRNLELQLGQRWSKGRPGFTATLRRRF